MMRNNALPTAHRAKMRLVGEILNGQFPVDLFLAPERALAKRYGISRVTMRAAIEALVREGVLQKIAGKGTLVCKLPGAVTTGNRAVGILFPYLKSAAGIATEHWYGEIHLGLHYTFSRAGYRVIVLGLGNEPHQARATIESHQDTVDGFVTFPYLFDELALLLNRTGRPWVKVGPHAVDDAVNYVAPNNFECGCLAAHHLIAGGGRRFGMFGVRGAGPTTYNQQRCEDGFLFGLANAGVTPDKVTIVPLTGQAWSMESGADAMRRVLQQPSRPDAIFVAGFLTALGALNVCRQAQLPLPDALALMGVDTNPSLRDFELTTIDTNLTQVGHLLADMLLRMIAKQSQTEPGVDIMPKLIQGKTTRSCIASVAGAEDA
ncbi:MAG: LacI family transcriptional regulator [Verrucomicrobia bacterium]|nr:LacI family transcriptional regulator [Verrucomicrobiota bacterium]MBU4290725.1 LacI family transcriptional regulator [Verrucomicrobiota bacterium]MBU4428412.1 LacI family transcriptional regulator [Verrucomicrobiota bacterium]MCG2680004.1 LacI family transcriptional regulator [Kiritimatiellia bacterium]